MINLGETYTNNYIVSEKIYIGFQELFNDKNPLHTDKSYAISKGFIDRVMYGNILNGFISHFIGESLPIKNVIIHSQQIKFIKPIYLNDNLTFQAIADEIFTSVSVIKFKCHFTNSLNQKVAKGVIQIGCI